MPASYRLPSFCSSSLPPLFFASFAAVSRICFCCSRLFSCRMPNAPQRVWSAGIGLAVFHFELTYWSKSLQGLYWSSSVNAIGWSAGIATVEAGAGAAAVCAGAGADADAAGADDAWLDALLLQPETASAAPTASAIGVRRCLCMIHPYVASRRAGTARRRDGAPDCASTGAAWRITLPKVMRGARCAGAKRLHTFVTVRRQGDRMDIVFHGAAGEVTGSCHLVEVAGKRVLLDCGMVQGDRKADERNAADFPFDPKAIDVLVLSHAHIDHTGRVPLLVKRGFAGPIFTHPATIDLATIMLADCANIAMIDAEHANRHLQPGQQPSVPLYTQDDVDAATKLMRPVEYGASTEILPGVRVTLRDAGHILGSATVEIDADEHVDQPGASRKLVFTGDLGPDNTPILCDPAPVPAADLVVMESTYGDRLHKSRED